MIKLTFIQVFSTTGVKQDLVVDDLRELSTETSKSASGEPFIYCLYWICLY